MQTTDAKMPYMLDERHLWVALAAAFALHMMGFVVYHYMPKTIVKDIPIRTLNLRLGDVDDTELEQMSQGSNFANAPAVEAIIDSVAKEMSAKPHEAPQAADMPKPAPKAQPLQSMAPRNEPKQYVREVSMPGIPSTLKGDTTNKEAEVVSRYTQLTSLWIKKFQVYPEEAHLSGIEGATTVRIRIDRKGNIRFYKIERSSGVEMLDKAAIDMIKRANPVPAVPENYPKDDLLEFLIPVNFSLQ